MQKKALTVGEKTRITATYDGSMMKIYINNVLDEQKSQSGIIKAPESNTVMMIGANPSGSNAVEMFANIDVYSVKVHNVALAIREIWNSATVVTSWDVSAQADGSIKAWIYSQNQPYTVYIGSTGTIYANSDSTDLFAHIGYSSICTATTVIENLNLLNTSNVTNMDHMFYYFGYNAMTSLDLGNYFNTGNVTSMMEMFVDCGHNSMTSLNLGSLFNTSNVTNMNWMFARCGYEKMTSLSLGSNFYTYSVQTMKGMFQSCGYSSMTRLDLGAYFNTGNVTDMYAMFHSCGYKAMTSLDLGTLFNTANVTNMNAMFISCGHDSMTSLNLGGNFYTHSATNMDSMFNDCGYEKMTSLSLEGNFNTSKVTTMRQMFTNCGYKSMTTLNLGSQFNTSSVESMYRMFDNCGYNAMTSLDLGQLFDTSNVTNMQRMFTDCGHNSMVTLNLGNKFNTSNVTNMLNIFNKCGYESMTSLNLGDLFDTSKITEMQNMFTYCGYTSMTSLNLGSKFNTSNVTNMYGMFMNCGFKSMTSLNLGNLFNTSNVTDMRFMFQSCGHDSMTNLNLGNLFDTSNVNNMKGMFWSTGYEKMTSLNLGSKFNTSNVTDMSIMFNETGFISMTSLDLGPAFTKIADTNTNIFYKTGKSGAVINAPESIYKNRTSFKLSSTDTSTAAGIIAVPSGRTVEPKYRPQWEASLIYLNTSLKAVSISLKGSTTKSGYSASVTSNINADDVSVYIDGVELKNTQNAIVVESSDATSITYTFTIGGFEEALRRSGKSYKEWSGNITLKIAGRGEATSTYTKKALTDAYGNQSMSQIDSSETWVDVTYKDSTQSTSNAVGKLFADFINPEFTYEYANTTIDHGNKKVTLVFDVTDKYFASSALSTDTTASNITVKLGGVVATNATKSLTKISDLLDTVNGAANTKIGERYQLEVSNLNQGDGGNYSGVMTLSFANGIIKDKSNNGNIAKTLTVGIDDPTTGDGDNQGIVVDFVEPIWKVENINKDSINQNVTLDLVATDKYLTGVDR